MSSSCHAPGRALRQAGAAGSDGRKHILVHILAEDGGRLDDRALARRQGGQQAADDNGQIG